MARPHLKPRAERRTFIERRTDKIVNARSLTVGLAITFVLLALAGAVVIWIVDRHDFPSLGVATWWSLQTVTTVGYGDVVPTTVVGRLIGGVELVLGVSFVAFLTAGVTSNVIQREGARAEEAENAEREQEANAILDALTETRNAITALDSRLDAIESKLSG
jgi:voltage-gated potassium channel Kch